MAIIEETNLQPPSREAQKIIIRLPDGMRDHLKAAAGANRRSVNAEVVVILEEHLANKTVDASAKSTPTV